MKEGKKNGKRYSILYKNNSKSNNFSFVVQWSFAQIKLHAQCGIMLRIDEKNWLKASIIYDNPKRPMIGTSVTQNGYSDWAAQDIPDNVNNIWFKIKRNNGEDTVYYSLDGVKFKPIRLVYMQQNTDEVKVGAYICSPENTGFDATLSQLSFEY